MDRLAVKCSKCHYRCEDVAELDIKNDSINLDGLPVCELIPPYLCYKCAKFFLFWTIQEYFERLPHIINQKYKELFRETYSK